jgi:hypothetical protein
VEPRGVQSHSSQSLRGDSVVHRGMDMCMGANVEVGVDGSVSRCSVPGFEVVAPSRR